MEAQLQTSHEVFWRELRPALTAAGLNLSKYLLAIRILKDIEGEGKYDENGQPLGGQTGYLHGVDPWQALLTYISHVRDGAPAPEWLVRAQRG